MKKLILCGLFVLTALSFANSKESRGGFRNTVSNLQISKISDKASWLDDQNIILEGNIIRQVGKDDYVFKDATGEITVEIDNDVWKNEIITPQDKVRVYVEVDKNWKELELEVYKLEKIK